jgi:hypothetical protein
MYVVQAFSRGADGRLVCDAPAWSQDRSFAATLTEALARTKAGVLTIEAIFNSAGEVAPEGQIIASYGQVPTSLILPAALAPPIGSDAVACETRLRA